MAFSMSMLEQYLAEVNIAERGQNVLIFGGVSALASALSSLVFAGIPKGKSKAVVIAWVVGTTLLGAGASGLTYYIASRRPRTIT